MTDQELDAEMARKVMGYGEDVDDFWVVDQWGKRITKKYWRPTRRVEQALDCIEHIVCMSELDKRPLYFSLTRRQDGLWEAELGPVSNSCTKGVVAVDSSPAYATCKAIHETQGLGCLS